MKKILVFRPDQLGDVILATPVFENLKKYYPKSEIISLTGSWAKNILENNPYIDKKIYYDYAFFDRDHDYKYFKKIINLFRLIILIRKEKIDIFIDLKGHLKSLIICYLSSAKQKIGKSNGWRGLFLTMKIKYRSDLYELENNLNVISLICKIHTKKISFFPNKYELERSIYLNTFSKNHIVSIFPFAPSSIKRLPISYWKKIIKFLNKNQISVFIFGGNDASDFVDEIEIDKNKNCSFVGQTSICETYLLVKKSGFCLSVDSMGGHIAAASEVPTLVIFTYANPIQWSPYNSEIDFIHKKFECFPCRVPYDMKVCHQNNKCLTSISYEEFEEKVLRLINKTIF